MSPNRHIRLKIDVMSTRLVCMGVMSLSLCVMFHKVPVASLCDVTTRSLCGFSQSYHNVTKSLCHVTKSLCHVTKSLCDVTKSFCDVTKYMYFLFDVTKSFCDITKSLTKSLFIWCHQVFV